MNKVRSTITIDPDVSEKIKNLSENEDRSFSQQINKILKDYLEEKPTK